MKKIIFIYFIFVLSSIISLTFAATAAICMNAPHYTQYICCPEKGGWIVSDHCSLASSACAPNDIIAGSNPPISILEDCIKRGGNEVRFPF